MWNHVIAVLALSALCIAWALFQRWLAKIDPKRTEDDHERSGCSGCGNCNKR